MFAKIVFLISIVSAASESAQIQPNDTKVDSIFVEVNSQLQGIWDGIFSSLKLDKNFTNKTKVDIMTTMTETMNNISEIHFKVYENIKNITVPEGKSNRNGTENPLFNLSCVIEEIFVENDYFLRNNKLVANQSLKEFYRALVGNNNGSEVIIIEADSNEVEQNETVDAEIIKHNNTYNNTHTRHKKKHYKINIDNKVQYKVLKSKYGLRAWRLSNLTLELENLSRTRRIFKSIRARVKRYPFVASIMILGEFVCAGSIISKHLVITAASCLQLAYQDKQFLRRPGAVTVRVGSDYPDRGGELLTIIAATFHPKYDSVYLKNNLVVIQVDRALDFMRGMKRIEYERTNRDVGYDVTILGWGDKNNYNAYNGSLETAKLQVFGLDACKRIYSPRYVDETNFCGGYVDVGGGACNRDVGGPALIGSTLLGVINFGPPVCGSPNSPTVFTKLGNYVQWIDDIVLLTQTTEPPSMMSSPRASRNEWAAENPSNKGSSNVLSSPLRVLTSLFKNLVSRGNIDLDAILYPSEDIMQTTKIDMYFNNRPTLETPPQYYGYTLQPGRNGPPNPFEDTNMGAVITPPPREFQPPSPTLGDDILKQIDRVRDFVEQHILGDKMLRKNTETVNYNSYSRTEMPTTPMSMMSMREDFSQYIRKPTEPFFDPDMPNDGDDDEREGNKDDEDKSSDGLNLDLDDDDPKKSKYISEIDDELESKKIEHIKSKHNKKKSNKRKKSKKHRHKQKHRGHKSHRGSNKDPRRPLESLDPIDRENDFEYNKDSNDREINPAHYHIEEDDDNWDMGLNRRSILDYINI